MDEKTLNFQTLEHGGERTSTDILVHFTSIGITSSSIVDGYVLYDVLNRESIADRKQDWELINNHSISNDDYPIFKINRTLGTKDSFDRPLVDSGTMFASSYDIWSMVIIF